MDDAPLNRRLAAILFVDVVGYSRLMGQDEQGTHEAVQRLHMSAFQPAIRSHAGQIKKFMGDGMLAEFASAVNCVSAAIDLQRRVAEVNKDIAAERPIMVRIGVNLADVIGEGSDVFGDGVNIAARLEGIAEPGGICISEKVFNEVQGRLPFAATDLGWVDLKNIVSPVRAFSINLEEGSPIPAGLNGTASIPRRIDSAVPSYRADKRAAPNLGNVLAVVIGYPGMVIGLGLMGLPPALYAAISVWLLLSIVAAYQMARPDLRRGVANQLRDRTFTQVYLRIMTRPVAAIWNRYGDTVEEPATVGALLRGALTWRLFDTALLLALAYPILSILLWWVVNGRAGGLGTLVLLPEQHQFWPNRAILLAVFGIALSGRFWKVWTSASPNRALRWLSPWLPWVAVVLALVGGSVVPGPGPTVGAISIGVALVGTGASAVAIALTLAIVLAGDLTFAVGAGVFFAIMGTGAVIYLNRKGKFRAARLVISLLIISIWIAAAWSFDWARWPDDCKSIFVFLAVFPLLNAAIDALSYAVTLALIRKGLSAEMPLFWGAVDAALALILFLVLGALLVTVIAGLNRLAGAPLLDLGATFAGIWQSWQPEGPDHLRPHLWDYAWIYTMLFSSALPTAVHLLVSLIGIQGIVPRSLRLQLAQKLEAGPSGSGEMIVQAGLVSAVWFLPFLLGGALLWALWWLGVQSGALGLLGRGYFDMLLWLAGLEGAF